MTVDDWLIFVWQNMEQSRILFTVKRIILKISFLWSERESINPSAWGWSVGIVCGTQTVFAKQQLTLNSYVNGTQGKTDTEFLCPHQLVLVYQTILFRRRTLSIPDQEGKGWTDCGLTALSTCSTSGGHKVMTSAQSARWAFMDQLTSGQFLESADANFCCTPGSYWV